MDSNKPNEDWYGRQVETNSDVPLINDGTGKPYIIRQFQFAFSPDILIKIRNKKVPVPTRQELFNSNWRQIQIMLWSDGLIASQEVPPRMLIGKKKYKIILLCEPRSKVMVSERPRTLQEITKPQ